MNDNFDVCIFDMDGTIVNSSINWDEVRNELRIDSGKTILEEIIGPDFVDEDKLKKLQEIELKNALKAVPVNGIGIFLEKLNWYNKKTALITNNSEENTSYLLNKFKLKFDIVITREKRMWKPAPDALLHVLETFSIKPDRAISIGDSHFDIKASKSAGIKAIYIINESKSMLNCKDDIIYFSCYNDLYKKILN